jgi:hypothetical protein
MSRPRHVRASNIGSHPRARQLWTVRSRRERYAEMRPPGQPLVGRVRATRGCTSGYPSVHVRTALLLLGFAPSWRVDAQLSHSLAHRLSRPRLRRAHSVSAIPCSPRALIQSFRSSRTRYLQIKATPGSTPRLHRHLPVELELSQYRLDLPLTCVSYQTSPLPISHFVCLAPARLVRPRSEVTQLGGQSSVHIPNLALHRRLNMH